jgi:hypothetical protein
LVEERRGGKKNGREEEWKRKRKGEEYRLGEGKKNSIRYNMIYNIIVYV